MAETVPAQAGSSGTHFGHVDQLTNACKTQHNLFQENTHNTKLYGISLLRISRQ